MSYDRSLLPDPIAYFDAEGLPLTGRATWRTTRCYLHGGSDSMRVSTASGGWCCMACGAKGGDVLAYAMQRHGLEFVEAARSLGAWLDDGKPQRHDKPRTLSAREAMELVAFDLQVLFVVLSDARRGLLPSDTDWQRFLERVGRVERLAGEYRT